MEKIPTTIVIHKHVDGAYTRFSTMEGPLTNNPLGKWFAVFRRGTYQAASEDTMWTYKTVSDLWPDVDPDNDYINYGSSDEVEKN